MSKHGFKELTIENWTEPDEISSVFAELLPNGETKPIRGNDWMHRILTPKLSETVPDEVQALFEVARGTLAYGYFFYPLYTLGEEQLWRVVEAAVSYKCKVLGAPNSTKAFGKKIDFLISKKIIPEKEQSAWNAIRELRNIASHPEHQSIVTPVMVIRTLRRVADKINSVF